MCPCDPPGLTHPPGPTVISTVPTDGATNVDRDANIKAKFSEKMKKSSINRGTVQLYIGHRTYQDLNPDPSTCFQGECGFPIAEFSKVGYSDKKKHAILNPKVRLEANIKYTAVVRGGDNFNSLGAVKDKGGTEMATTEIWYFTTGDS